MLNNDFTGSIPTQLGSLSNVRKWSILLYDVTPLSPTFSSTRAVLSLGYFSKEVMFLHSNLFEGSMPSEICNLRTTGALTQLTADCAGENPAVVCPQPSCCTACFPPRIQ